MSGTNRVDEVRAALHAADIYVLDQADLAHGIRLSLSNDGIVTVYNSGKVLVQGMHQDATKAALGELGTSTRSAASAKVAPAASTPLALPHGWRSCPQCEQLLSTTWRHCIKCGTDLGLSDDTEPCSACIEPVDRAWSCCPACGDAL